MRAMHPIRIWRVPGMASSADELETGLQAMSSSVLMDIEKVGFTGVYLMVRLGDIARSAVLPEVPPVGCYPAATDAPWFVAAGVPAIPAFGPGLLPLAHSPNEYVEINSLFACSRIYALAAFDYLQ